jgi:hypothetical protein
MSSLARHINPPVPLSRSETGLRQGTRTAILEITSANGVDKYTYTLYIA